MSETIQIKEVLNQNHSIALWGELAVAVQLHQAMDVHMHMCTGAVHSAEAEYSASGLLYTTLRLLLLTGLNFSDFAILFTFRVLILAILDFNHKTHRQQIA